MLPFRVVFVTGLFVLWLSCFVANNVERLETPAELVPQRNTTKIVEEETTNQTVLIENVTVTTPMVRIVNVTRCTNETIIFDFDKSCFSFFTVSTNFFTTVFALLHLENISSKPRIRWLMCVMLCYGMGIVAHMSFYHTHFESTLVISASIIGAVWAVLLSLRTATAAFSMCFQHQFQNAQEGEELIRMSSLQRQLEE